MSYKEYKIKIPDDFAEQSGIHSSIDFTISKDHHKLVIEALSNQNATESTITKWFLIPSTIATIIYFFSIMIQTNVQIPLSGSGSLATFLIYLGMLSGMASFTYFFINKKKNNSEGTEEILWRNVPTIIISFGVTLALLLAAFFWLLGKFFVGASFDRITSTFLFFIFIAFINYFMMYLAHVFTSPMIVSLLIAVIIGGVFFAMLTNAESQWWQYNFSFLGTNQAIRSWPFNVTLILSAFIMIALVDYLFVLLNKNGYRDWGILTLRVLLTCFSIALGGVGLFPDDGGLKNQLHVQAAGLLVTIMLVLIVGIRWFLPQAPKSFLYISYGIGIMLVISNILFEQVGYFSLTVFEIVAFGSAFSWILLLLQQINRLTMPPKHEIHLELLNVE